MGFMGLSLFSESWGLLVLRSDASALLGWDDRVHRQSLATQGPGPLHRGPHQRLQPGPQACVKG
jgi:hypothetical protein